MTTTNARSLRAPESTCKTRLLVTIGEGFDVSCVDASDLEVALRYSLLAARVGDTVVRELAETSRA